MFSVFESLKSFTKIREISIDDLTFKLHYRVTELFLILCSILVTCYQYWGSPISCRVSEGEAGKSIEDFCWISSTFTLPAFTDGKIGINHIHPGVAAGTDQDERKYHTYYQWVSIVLVFQGSFFVDNFSRNI